ncbi:hypothetical protein Nepgr_010586 [Nepenthes gracilis]|uniref:Uncharacterized protein n=1 Tax=Nepenthes gracilis TaxID=150966 RepID=A0AAD3XLJ9_NEPGR|nr:hypothetical protein Nepgr_010586 [Nepenthes gracilis]
MLDAALLNMRLDGRSAARGMLSQYNRGRQRQPAAEGVNNSTSLVHRRVRMEGFVVFDYRHLQSNFSNAVLPNIRSG